MAEVHLQVNGEKARSPQLISPVKRSFASECRSLIRPHTSAPSVDSDSRSMRSQDSRASGFRAIFHRNKKTPGDPTGEKPGFLSPFSSGLHRSQVSLLLTGHHDEDPSPITPAERKRSNASAQTTGKLMSFGRRSRYSMQPRASRSFPRDISLSPTTATAMPTKSPTSSSELPILSQAYADAIKDAQLPASSLPADTIIRINNRDKLAAAAAAKTYGSTTLKKNEPPKTKRRSHSQTIANAEWTEKIFVLVVGGYLLQYAAEGAADRLPEKVLQLGKRSVAFASDVIPGKHWVLQISQEMDDGSMAIDSRSLMARLSFRSSEYRRLTSNMLLVFQSIEEMQSWLTVFRQEIEALGGKKHAAETTPGLPEDEVEQDMDEASDARPVSSIPEVAPRCPDPISPQGHSFLASWDDATEDELDRAQKQAVDVSLRPVSQIRQSTDTALSHRAPFDMARDDARLSYSTAITDITPDDTRLSYVTARTSLSSRSASPSRELDDAESQKRAESFDHVRSGARSSKERRISVPVAPTMVTNSTPEAKTAVKRRPLSTQDVPKTRPATHQSVSAPDLTLSSAAKQRLSLSPQPSFIPAFPEVLTAVRPTPTARKPPPPVLALARPLSPVQDEPSPLKQEHLQKSTCGSFYSEDTPKQSPTLAEAPVRPRTASGSNRSHRAALAVLESGRRTPDSPRSSQEGKGLRNHPSLRELRNEILAEDDEPESEAILLPNILLPPSPRSSPRSSIEFSVSPLTGTPPTTAPPDMPLPTPPTSSCSKRASKRLSGMSVVSASGPSRTSSPVPRRSSSRQSVNRSAMTPSPTLSHRQTQMDPKGKGKGCPRRLSLQHPTTNIMGPPPAPPPNKELPSLPRCASPAMQRSATPDLIRSATPDTLRGSRRMKPSPMKASPMKETKAQQLNIDTSYKGKGPPSPMERRKIKRGLKASA